MFHIKGFRPIGKGIADFGIVAGWFAQFNRYELVGLTNLAGVQEFIEMSMATRVPMVLELTKAFADQRAEEAGRQDERMQSKALAKYAAFINGMQSQLTDDLLAMYDEPLTERILQYTEETAEYLNSPQRKGLKEGKLKLLQSRFIVKTIELRDVEDTSDLGRLASEAAAAIQAEPLEPAGEEPADVAQVPDYVMPEQPSSSRPPRNAPVRRLADEDEGPQHASKKKPAPKRAADDEADPPNINPRTKKPYVRGGPYKLPKTPGAAPIARAVCSV
jgi:hypothetical protein